MTSVLSVLARARAKVVYIALHLAIFLGYAPWFVREALHKTDLMGTDFAVFYTGWTLVVRGSGRLLYDIDAQRVVEHALYNGREFPGGLVPFLHPPHAALVMAPLALLPRTAATWLWTLVQLVSLAWLGRALTRVAGLVRTLDQWIIGAALLACPPVFASLQFGQLAIIMAVALLGLVLAEREGRDGVAAVCLLVLSAKPHLLPIPLAVLVAHRRWGIVLRAGLAGAALAALTMAVLGVHIYSDYLVSLPRLEPYWGVGLPHYMVNLRGTLIRLFAADHRTVSTLTAAGFVASIGAAYIVARREADGRRPDGETWSVVLAVGLILNPHLFIHDVILWTVPLVLFYAQLERQGAHSTPFAAFVLSWPLVGVVNDLLEQRQILLPIHLLFAEAFVAAVWILSRYLERPARTPDSVA
ncbi:MAG: hypothetical protein JWM82_723 [Myxococcales bacterium]|nr:hypothetical protein [Myxococcales bacterium]